MPAGAAGFEPLPLTAVPEPGAKFSLRPRGGHMARSEIDPVIRLEKSSFRNRGPFKEPRCPSVCVPVVRF